MKRIAPQNFDFMLCKECFLVANPPPACSASWALHFLEDKDPSSRGSVLGSQPKYLKWTQLLCVAHCKIITSFEDLCLVFP
jgi:hypothetical protein